MAHRLGITVLLHGHRLSHHHELVKDVATTTFHFTKFFFQALAVEAAGVPNKPDQATPSVEQIGISDEVSLCAPNYYQQFNYVLTFHFTFLILKLY